MAEEARSTKDDAAAAPPDDAASEAGPATEAQTAADAAAEPGEGEGDAADATTTTDDAGGRASAAADAGAGSEGSDGSEGSEGSGGSGADGGDELDAAALAVTVDLEALLAEREQFLDAYRRAQADFENYRKQAQKRLDDALARELGGFVERLLPVLDACDAAAAQGEAAAVEPILSALFGALEKEGLERIDPKGEEFDPAVAEAVVHEPGEGGTQMVADVLRTGYRWRGRVLRPAMVKVID